MGIIYFCPNFWTGAWFACTIVTGRIKRLSKMKEWWTKLLVLHQGHHLIQSNLSICLMTLNLISIRTTAPVAKENEVLSAFHYQIQMNVP